MKKFTFILLALCMAGRALADEASWLTSFPEAANQARRENKLLLLDFTGSDWCGWCMKLNEETFSKPEFKDYASKYLVTVLVDFPMHKSQSDDLKEANGSLKAKYGVKGYPTVLVMKPDGTVLWKQPGYMAGGPPAMINAVNKCRRAAGLSAPSEVVSRVAVAPSAPAPVPRPAAPVYKAGDQPKIQAILYSPSHSAAVLNGRTCEEGDFVNGMRVLKIARDGVTVEFQGQTKILRMD